MSYRIWCEVWGGVTGPGAAWLKSNGNVLTFNDYATAKAEAEKLKAARQGNPYRTASFNYTVYSYSCGKWEPGA